MLDFTVSRSHEKQIQMINFINITFCFSFLCRKLKGLRHREETKLSWYVLVTSSQILHLWSSHSQRLPNTHLYLWMEPGKD